MVWKVLNFLCYKRRYLLKDLAVTTYLNYRYDILYIYWLIRRVHDFYHTPFFPEQKALRTIRDEYFLHALSIRKPA